MFELFKNRSVFLFGLAMLVLLTSGCGNEVSGFVKDVDGHPIQGVTVSFYEHWTADGITEEHLIDQFGTNRAGYYKVTSWRNSLAGSPLVEGKERRNLITVKARKDGYLIGSTVNLMTVYKDGKAVLLNGKHEGVNFIGYETTGDNRSTILSVLPNVDTLVEAPMQLSALADVSPVLEFDVDAGYFVDLIPGYRLQWSLSVSDLDIWPYRYSLGRGTTFDFTNDSVVDGATLKLTLNTLHWVDEAEGPVFRLGEVDSRQWPVRFPPQDPPVWHGSVVTAQNPGDLSITNQFTEIRNRLHLTDVDWQGVSTLSNIQRVQSVVLMNTESVVSWDNFSLNSLQSILFLGVNRNALLQSLRLDLILLEPSSGYDWDSSFGVSISKNTNLGLVEMDQLNSKLQAPIDIRSNDALERISFAALNMANVDIENNPKLREVVFSNLTSSGTLKFSGGADFNTLNLNRLENVKNAFIVETESSSIDLQLSSLCGVGPESRIVAPNVCQSLLIGYVDQIASCSGSGGNLSVIGKADC